MILYTLTTFIGYLSWPSIMVNPAINRCGNFRWPTFTSSNTCLRNSMNRQKGFQTHHHSGPGNHNTVLPRPGSSRLTCHTLSVAILSRRLFGFHLSKQVSILYVVIGESPELVRNKLPTLFIDALERSHAALTIYAAFLRLYHLSRVSHILISGISKHFFFYSAPIHPAFFVSSSLVERELPPLNLYIHVEVMYI